MTWISNISALIVCIFISPFRAGQSSAFSLSHGTEVTGEEGELLYLSSTRGWREEKAELQRETNYSSGATALAATDRGHHPWAELVFRNQQRGSPSWVLE